ncbi:30S ribosomal protein S13 [bacterium CG2_30_37_16]|nr:MAG: 30S ribosomal protein S13 [bacterium CG2_30_37_16]PIP30727.1 MAG: 30S ribosomal protein S13 [bacterium (Candidatus Howlettbacteria) CG23_combo_of_CG06-09_8_20_14_all_37_9]PIX99265.1 MAG: 30S ribosomal protein S13 [bacterium (Candidatus Howlettbacteria) CG_4_10_14_3_um_filter_37_10]PJB05582.1 MAG: 30S ribosomal protein S13 [bacterium (Candidatus Howlettbacteria) CG_4_9_14_3_um_filter_37_10]
MARIKGVDLPREKRIEIALTYIYGIGLARSHKILEQTKINADTRVSKLTESEVNRIREIIEKNFTVEGDLRREVQTDIKRLKDISSYRGNRHKSGLPVRGQRTKTNSRTKRGRKVTIGSGKKKAPGKT